MSNNKNLKQAKTNKKDEFYTQLSDIENELKHYKEHFKDKVVFCNCDDPTWSNFWKYFYLSFKVFGLKKLIATHYEYDKPSYKLECFLNENNELETVQTDLVGNGDFRSEECVQLLKEADIVCTNPPFSLFREYVAQLIEHNKKFLIIGHQNSITYKEIFPLIKNNKMWLGYGFRGGASHFINKHYEDYATAGDHKEGMIRVPGVCWFTNLEHDKRHEELLMYKTYYGNEKEFLKYDNYDAINVNKTKEIPDDYKGVMGVPITFLEKYNPNQFEIIGLGNSDSNFKPNKFYTNCKKILKDGKIKNGSAINKVLVINVKQTKEIKYTADNINGYLIAPYARILIKRKDK